MENASRAVVMAAGVFIAIAVISVALYAVNIGRGYASTAEDLISASQVQSFNRFYTAHNSLGQPPKEIKCIDAINILNRAVEDEFLDANVVETSSLIQKVGDFYTIVGDHTEYYTMKVKYSFTKDSVGQVSTILIQDI